MQIYYQLGNAVVPPMVELIAQCIVNTGVFQASE
jgi:site-specific DNA-cytosine methylase